MKKRTIWLGAAVLISAVVVWLALDGLNRAEVGADTRSANPRRLGPSGPD